MSEQFELTLRNQDSEIARLHDRLEAFGTEHRMTARAVHEVQLALEEHLTNLLKHGYKDESEHQIHIRVSLNPGEMRVEVEDDGTPFDPLKHPTPDLSTPMAERPIGGLGIHMIRKSVDGLDYRRFEGKNVLVMIKTISPGLL
ncbi:MAG TPA: ATP-binding protein [Candidatus Dormibacteraeota bacterium]|nr:ATP-binding protein [Candidatus Dormibacteraeota bacterium]